MLFFYWVVNSLYLATPKSGRVLLMLSCHMLCVADPLYLATPKGKRVPSSLSLVCTLCVVGACGRALAGTLLLIWGVHKHVSLFSLLVRIVLLCVANCSPTSPNSGTKS